MPRIAHIVKVKEVLQLAEVDTCVSGVPLQVCATGRLRTLTQLLVTSNAIEDIPPKISVITLQAFEITACIAFVELPCAHLGIAMIADGRVPLFWPFPRLKGRR